MLMEFYNGVRVPQLGFGTASIGSWQQSDAYVTEVIRKALVTGYRHIDTASFYNTERNVGWAIQESGIPRDDLFITTKCWGTDAGYDAALLAFEKSLKRFEFGLSGLLSDPLAYA